MTHSRPAIHELLSEHGLAPRRELGQNFVADPNTVRRIASLAEVGEGDLVVEIGPGLGSLTLALIETGADVIAIEVDPGLAQAVTKVVGNRATVVEADALTVDWNELLSGDQRPVRVVANLPYNVGTTLIIDILAGVPAVSAMLVLVQTEVAERLTAPVGTREYGIPTILVARHAAAEIVGRVPASVFVPRPKVESSLVRLDRHATPPCSVEHDRLAALVRAAFGQRRKMLRRSLAPYASEQQLRDAGIDPTERAEQVELERWCRLVELL